MSVQLNEIQKPTIQDTALVRMPIWLFGLTVGRALGKKSDSDDSDLEDDEVVTAETDSSSGAGGKRTPSTGSVDDDFELLDKSLEDVSATATAKTTGSQPQSGKNNKRKSKSKKK